MCFTFIIVRTRTYFVIQVPFDTSFLSELWLPLTYGVGNFTHTLRNIVFITSQKDCIVKLDHSYNIVNLLNRTFLSFFFLLLLTLHIKWPLLTVLDMSLL